MRRWLAALASGALLLALLLLTLDRLYPLPLQHLQAGGTLVLARDGSPLRAFAGRDGVWRYPTTPEAVSPRYLEALLGYEDRWFWRHPGVNPAALLRAALQSAASRRIVSGGSTLSMQVARLVDPVPRTLAGKLRQILRALQLEWHLDKRAILTLYLNHAPFGGNVEGVEAASHAWFGKSAAQLSHAEAALLAVLPQAPSRLRPDRHAARAQAARDKLLDRMADFGIWSAALVADARIESVATRRLRAPQLAPLLAERLRREHPGQAVIRSTIDAQWQRIAEQRVQAWLRDWPPRSSAAVLIVDSRTREVLAYVGSAHYGDALRLGHVDMVRAWRSPGSTLKPFLYAMAIDQGLIHSESLLVDAPTDFDGYAPGNFGDSFHGLVGAADALKRSLNVPAVTLLRALGPAEFRTRLDHVGLRLRLPSGAAPGLPLILGGTAVRLDALTAAYTAFADAGQAAALRFTPEAPLQRRHLLSPGAAWIVREVLASNTQDGELPFTARALRGRIAFKTGTSYGYRDAWALGTQGPLTFGVWVGRPDGTPLPGSYGVVSALPLLFQLQAALPRSVREPPPIPRPDSVTEAAICWPGSQAPDPQRPRLCQRRRQAWVLDGVIPPTLPDPHAPADAGYSLPLWLDAAGRRRHPGCLDAGSRRLDWPRWPVLAWPWLSPSLRAASEVPPWSPACVAPPEWRSDLLIRGVRPGTVLRAVPGSAEPLSLRVEALGSSLALRWLLNERLVARGRGNTPVLLKLEEGPQRLMVIDAAGRHAEVQFRVQAGEAPR
jgi:penicillin-binding protein 1C